MPNLFKAFKSKDIDEELDLEFDINSPDNSSFEMPPDKQDN